MKILALETATDPGSVALWINGEVTVEECPHGRPNSETLLPIALAQLKKADLDFSGLDAIAFGAGPGSFTGLRIACGIAQGIALATGLPLISVGTLDAIAALGNAEQMLVTLDARMGEVYYGCYVKGLLQDQVGVCAPQNVPVPAVVTQTDKWIVSGNAPEVYPILKERLAPLTPLWQPELMPSAHAVAHLAAIRFEEKAFIDPAEAAPLYVRNKVAKTVEERLAEGGRA